VHILASPYYRDFSFQFTKLARALRIPTGGNVHLGSGPAAARVATPDDEEEDYDLK
jgi:hypothetical protein